MIQTGNPFSPIFLILLVGILVDAIYAWSGVVRGQLPNMRTSIRGARLAGVLAAVSIAFLLISYYYFNRTLELYGTMAFGIAFALTAGGVLLAERIPD